MKKHSSELFFTLGLVGIFFVTSVMVVIIGIQSFRNINGDIRKTYNMRTSLAYIQEKVRQMDENGMIRQVTIEDSNGYKIPALAIGSKIGDVTFMTYIYAYDHTLRELFLRESYEPKAENGTALTEIESLIIQDISDKTEQHDNTYRISIIDKDGKESIMLLYPYSKINDVDNVKEVTQ